MSQRWHYQIFGEQFGPVSESELRQLVASGTLSPRDLVRLEAFKDWLPAAEALQLDGITGGDDLESADLAAEISDLSELAFEFEDADRISGRHVQRSAAIPIRSAVSSSRSEGRTATDVKPDAAGNDDVDGMLTADPLVQWFYQSFGEEFGPVALSELLSLAAEGELAGSDLVREGPVGEWRPAAEVSGLSAALSLAQPLDETQSGTTAAAAKRFGDSGPGKFDESASRAEKSSADSDTGFELSPRALKPDKAPSPPAAEKKVRKRKGKSREEAVLNEIFDEVFTEETPAPRRAAGATASSLSAVMDSDPGLRTRSADASDRKVSTSATAPVAVPSPASATPTPAAAGFSSASVAPGHQASRPMSPAPSLSPRRSRGSSMSLPDPKLLVTVVLIVALVGAIWQFNLLSFLRSYSVADLPDCLNKVVAECKALGTAPAQADWDRFAGVYRSELTGYYESLMSGGSTDPKVKAQILATKQAMSLVAGHASQPEYIKKNLEKLEELISAMPK